MRRFIMVFTGYQITLLWAFSKNDFTYVLGYLVGADKGIILPEILSTNTECEHILTEIERLKYYYYNS